MDTHTKYQTTRIVSLLAMLAVTYCFYRVIPPGLSGDVQRVKMWIGLAFVASSLGIACALAMYYYRAKLQQTETGKVAATTLGKAGAKQKQPNAATIHKSEQKSV